jgi:cysteine desulfurase
MQPFFARQFYNPSATYTAAREVHVALDEARAGVAHWLGARPPEIVFTAGGTEANNLAIHGVMRGKARANVVVSSVEHESVLEPAGEYERRMVTVDHEGRIDLDDLRRKIDRHTALVSVMYANNEIGTVQPIRDIAAIIAEKRAERTSADATLLLHADACQAANYLDLHVSRLGVDLMTINAGKIYGPKQAGALYVKGGAGLQAQILGGGQERGLRSGTENTAAAAGLAAALELVQSDRRVESARLQLLQQLFIAELEKQLPEATINGSRRFRLPNNVHVTFSNADNERLIFQLDEVGIMAAAGSACAADKGEPSHVLKAIGLSDEAAQSSLRFTMGRETTEPMVRRTVKTLAKLLST